MTRREGDTESGVVGTVSDRRPEERVTQKVGLWGQSDRRPEESVTQEVGVVWGGRVTGL